MAGWRSAAGALRHALLDLRAAPVGLGRGARIASAQAAGLGPARLREAVPTGLRILQAAGRPRAAGLCAAALHTAPAATSAIGTLLAQGRQASLGAGRIRSLRAMRCTSCLGGRAGRPGAVTRALTGLAAAQPRVGLQAAALGRALGAAVAQGQIAGGALGLGADGCGWQQRQTQGSKQRPESGCST